MQKKLLIVISVFVIGLLLWQNHLLIESNKKTQVQLESIKQESVEYKAVENGKTTHKTLMDQYLENSGRSVPEKTQSEEDLYVESSNYVDQSGLKNTFDQKCDEEQATYNTCLIKYNTEMLEYQNCQSGNQTFGCSPSSYKPSNSCALNVSSWCRKQILGYY